MNPYEIIQNLVDEYHSNPDAFSPEQGERLATQAFETGIPFRPETKKLAKFGFDTADTALFGMLPDQWRPERDGQDLYGESEGEKLAGGAGSILGLIPAGFGAGALIKGGLKTGKGLLGKAKMRIFDKSGIKKGGGVTETGLVPVNKAMSQNANQHVAQLPQGTSLLQLSQGARRLNPAQRALNPTSILNNTDDYLDTAINQAFIR
jgi:hypothetical protein|tara:strand:+ start:804 stop:1421 length:618 start_codon:yes stop_codon:yes gene_type:complete